MLEVNLIRLAQGELFKLLMRFSSLIREPVLRHLENCGVRAAHDCSYR